MKLDALPGIPEVRPGDDLAALLRDRLELGPQDVLVIAHKVVSKAEGRVVRLDEVEPSGRALALAADEDPRRLEVILRESARLAFDAAAAPFEASCIAAPSFAPTPAVTACTAVMPRSTAACSQP